MPEIDSRVVPFVAGRLRELPVASNVLTDEQVGMFVSHLIQALDRTLKGQALQSFDAQDEIDAAIAENPQTWEVALNIANLAESELDIALPETEARILSLHLALILGGNQHKKEGNQ